MTIRLNVTVSAGTGTGTGSFATAITASRTSVFAGSGTIFTIDASDSDKINLAFKWTYDRVHTFAEVSSSRLAGRSGNVSFGPVGSTVFDLAGTYVVTCRIDDGDEYQEITRDITVTSQDAAFPTTNTICIDAGSNWAGKPAGAQEVTSWAAALSALNTNDGGRILFNKGDSYNIGSGLVALYGGNWNGTTSANTVCFGAYGTGNRPIIDQSNGGFMSWNQLENSANVVTISGIEYLGDYSATAGTGTFTVSGGNGRPDGFVIGSGTNAGHFTIHDCKFSKLSQCISNIQSASNELYMVISDTTITEWEDYGIWMKRANISVIGCSIKQHPQAVNGTEGKSLGGTPNYPDHSCMRMSDNLITCIYGNDLFTRNGWSSGSKGWQPCIRLFTDGNIGGDTAISGNQCEGSGVGLITTTSENGGTSNVAGTAITVEQNHCVGSTASYRMIAIGKGNSAYRNNILIAPDVAPLPSWNDMTVFFQLDPDGSVVSANQSSPIILENNACIDLRSTANQSDDSAVTLPSEIAAAGWTNITERSNIYHAPNRTSPTVVANLSATDVFVPDCDGHRFNTSTPSSPTPSGVGSTASYKPFTGSGAIGNTTAALSAVADFDGNIRSAVVGTLTRTTYCDGPFEPALES